MGLRSLEPPPKLLVAGCSGFIGKATVSAAISRGMQVTGLSLRGWSGPHFESGFEYLNADISEFNSLANAIRNRKFDYVINCSGYIDHRNITQGGEQLLNSHFTGLLNLIRCVQHDRLKGFLQLGSSDEYGGAPSPQREWFREAPISPYAAAKVAACHLIQMMHRTEDFPGVVARLFLVYGPGQGLQRFIPQVIKGCIDDKSFPVSVGDQIRDFCYIDDVVEALLVLVQEEKAHGEVFNVASGKGTSIRSMIEMVQNSIGTGNPVFGEIPYRSGENMSLVADIEKISSLTGWLPATPLETGIKTTVNWFKNKNVK